MTGPSELLDLAREHGTPLLQEESATFIWEGAEPAVLIGDFNRWGSAAPQEVLEEAEPGVWARTISFPPDAYLEYSFVLDNERVNDPLNPRLAPDGIGGFHNWFGMPGFEETRLTQERPEGLRGTLTHLEVECGIVAVGELRPLHLYAPPVDEPTPLLIVLDGQDYLERGRLVEMVDTMLCEGRIRPISLALIDHGERARFLEYNCSDATVRFLMQAVIPRAREHLRLSEDTSLNGVLGASMGGLMALYAALRAPDHVGCALSQSGSFGVTSSTFESVIYDVVRCASARPRVWMDVGRYETLRASNENMYEVLADQSFDVLYREYNGGHNYVSWRNDVWRGLEALYGSA